MSSRLYGKCPQTVFNVFCQEKLYLRRVRSRTQNLFSNRRLLQAAPYNLRVDYPATRNFRPRNRSA